MSTVVESTRGHYERRGTLRRVLRMVPRTGRGRVRVRGDGGPYQRLSRELLAQRSARVRLRNEGTISDEALHRIELDLEETRPEN